MKRWRFDRGRLVFFFIVLFLYGFGLFWLKLHPEYTTYNPNSVVHQKDGSIIYINERCPENVVFKEYGQKMECEVWITDVPPAYYIHQWLLKYQPYMFWGGLIGMILWCIWMWDKIKSWASWLDKFMNQEEKIDKKRNKKSRNRK
jgi:hypothetical protein